MSTIKGIFEPFAEYVTEQLNLRKKIVSQKTKQDSLPNNNDGRPVDSDSQPNNNPLNIDGDLDTVNVGGEPINLSARNDLFYTYTTEKQCTIRMSSGVDVRKDNGILEENETSLTGDSLAKQYVLEGGIKYRDPFGGDPLRGGIESKKINLGQFGLQSNSPSAYGDPTLRSDAKDGFGIVPMPGIIDAEINTKSEDGSLREAKVNFICYNRRQLEILETLYMRPGYPILLEWGWTPFIDNDLEVNNNGYGMLFDFFSSSANLEKINEKIRIRKKDSGGNYDGFVGFIKNFLFKAREDGGYDCSTDIMAHGEILASLKAPSQTVAKLQTGEDFQSDSLNRRNFVQGDQQVYRKVEAETESIDKFLYFLRAIKTNLDKAGFKSALTYAGTSYQKDNGLATITRHPINNNNDLKKYQDLGCAILATKDYAICQNNDGAGDNGNEVWYNNAVPKYIEDLQLRGPNNFTTGAPDQNYNEIFGNSNSKFIKFSYYVDSEGNALPITDLNNQSIPYEEGFNKIKELVADVAKVSTDTLDNQLKHYDQIPDSIKNRHKYIGKSSRQKQYSSFKANTYTDSYTVSNARGNVRHGLGGANQSEIDDMGLSQIFEGTILKEFSVESESSTDSGFRKKIFLRWDLVCQILNKLVIPEYQENSSLAEITYLNSNQKTYKKGTPANGGKHGNNGTFRYIPYSLEGGKVLYPFDNLGFNATFIEAANARKPNSTYTIEEAQTLPNADHTELEYFQNTYGDDAVIDFNDRTVTFSPILGRSFDRNVCLMPHQILGMINAINHNVNAGEMNSPDRYSGETSGVSNSSSTKLKFTNFTSFQNVKAEANSIGHVYFNLDYLINQYEQLALEEYKTTDSLGEERTKRRLKKEFSLHDWITTIWNGVNDACAGYYDFGLHVEHERPNVARIIDFTMSGGSADLGGNKQIFTFEPQGLRSVTRDSYFQSKLDSDFSSTISIAAQVPNSIHSLEAVSFKAFHKGIKNRFTDDVNNENIDEETKETAYTNYVKDVEEYENNVRSILQYIGRMNQSNYESELVGSGNDSFFQTVLSPEGAKALATNIAQQRISISRRYPERDENNNLYDGSETVNYHYTGEFRYDLGISGSTTNERNAIIPLTSNMTMDGISGINPLQIYKIDPTRLPLGYQDPNIVFVVKKEKHNITSGQNWTTSIDGYLSFLNDNPATGQNLTLEIRSNQEVDANRLDRNHEAWEKWIDGFMWSASFISWCVRAAEAEALLIASQTTIIPGNYVKKFARKGSHTEFFSNEVSTKNQLRYEHLDPQTTPLQVGDIILQGGYYKREGRDHTKYPGPYKGSSHSDIVVSIEGNIATVVGGNIGPDKVGKKTYQLNSQGKLHLSSRLMGTGTNGGAPSTKSFESKGPGHLEPYSNGSILRNKGEQKSSGTSLYFDRGLSVLIGKVANQEYLDWDQTKTESDPETEDIVRKYVEGGNYKGINIPGVPYSTDLYGDIPPKYLTQ